MSQSVTRLKELLFDSESRRIAEVQRELEALAKREHEHHAGVTAQQTAITEKVSAAFDRAGSDEKLLRSVAGIIDGALREAEVTRHEPLSRAIAPLVVKTIKYELKNSQDEMVDALYPITGKLVKQYVRAAMNDLMADINRRLGGGRLSELEARAKAQGITVAELVLSETQSLKVDELFLVRRGAGDLVAHWERVDDDLPASQAASTGGSNRDVLIAGYLSGITAFSEEAFDDKQGSLRAIDMDGERIFVRASPAYLLAARCSGSAPAAVEQIIDDEFVQVLQAYKDALGKPAGASSDAEVNALLPTLAASFERRFAEKRDEIELKAAKALAAKPRVSRLQMAAALLLLPLAGWGAWMAYTGYMTSRTQQAAAAVIGSIEQLSGYPVRIDVSRAGQVVAISGLAPTSEAKDLVTRRLQSDVGWASAANNLTVLPASQDFTPEMEALRRNLSAFGGELSTLSTSPGRRALQRTVDRLDASVQALGGLKDRLADAAQRSGVDRIARELATARAEAERLRGALASGGIDAARQQGLLAVRSQLGSAEEMLAMLANVPRAGATTGAAPGDPTLLSEELALAAERIGGLIAAADRAAAVAPLNREIAALKQRIDGLKIAISPREELANFIRGNAIFFENGADLNSPAAADRTTERLAELMRATDVTLRVVGYTDERGGASTNNAALAMSRAERVVALLVERGIPRDRLVAIGRTAGPDISRATGPGTPNRRVEFEIAFEGEPIAR